MLDAQDRKLVMQRLVMQRLVMQRLGVDGVAVKVLRALRAADVPALLIKGPHTSRRLYDDRPERVYEDVDLLVAPEFHRRAEQVLSALGYRDHLEGARPAERKPHAQPWVRERGPSVDLHVTLGGVEAAPEVLWQRLYADRSRLRLGSTECDVPSDAALTLIVALHAAHHGRAHRRTVEDLKRAIERIPLLEWQRAHELSQELSAEAAFAASLSLLPEGVALAERIGIQARTSRAVEFRSAGAPGAAMGFGRLEETRGCRAKAALILCTIFPSPAVMRHWWPIARRGLPGLALAYLVRPFSLLRRAPCGLLDWWRARSLADGASSAPRCDS